MRIPLFGIIRFSPFHSFLFNLLNALFVQCGNSHRGSQGSTWQGWYICILYHKLQLLSYFNLFSKICRLVVWYWFVNICSPFYFVILRNASAVFLSITCYLLICYYSLHFEFWISNIIYMSTLLFNFVPVLKCSCFYVGLHHWTSEAGEESWGHVKG
jgi:hypothetical protein